MDLKKNHYPARTDGIVGAGKDVEIGLRSLDTLHPSNQFPPVHKTNSIAVDYKTVINALSMGKSNGGSQGLTLYPDRLLSPSLVKSPNEGRSTARMASELPSWVWCLLSYGLGISLGKPLSKIQVSFSSFLRFLSFVTAFGFAGCGLYINVHEAMNDHTKTSPLICMFKSAVGFSWILLGIYSHSLAVRSFSSKGLLNYIRLHSKTFMKISTIVWVAILCLSVDAVNIYSNVYLLHSARDFNITKAPDQFEPSCANVDAEVTICQIYFVVKVTFSLLNLVWILLIATVCFSVCRTHTICIRRFMKELSYDFKIYDEFSMLKLSQQLAKVGEPQEKIEEDDDGYTDDVIRKKDPSLGLPSMREKVWKSLRQCRRSVLIPTNVSGDETKNSREDQKHVTFERRLNKGRNATQHLDVERPDKPYNLEKLEENPKLNEGKHNAATDRRDQIVDEEDINMLPDLSTFKAPIMSNEDLLFTYFKMLNHVSITSRLLQRWMSSTIVFVIMWCIYFTLHWMSHYVKAIDIVQFLIPIIVLAFVISAYAEVNTAGKVLLTCILPTENRLEVIDYMINSPLQLKVYSFILTYKVLATFAAGVALSFATRIIINRS